MAQHPHISCLNSHFGPFSFSVLGSAVEKLEARALRIYSLKTPGPYSIALDVIPISEKIQQRPPRGCHFPTHRNTKRLHKFKLYMSNTEKNNALSRKCCFYTAHASLPAFRVFIHTSASEQKSAGALIGEAA